MREWTVILILSSALVVEESWAKGPSGAAILKLPLSVRQMGMGNVSVAGKDVLRAWSNPALLASQDTEGTVAISGASMFGGEDTTLGLGVGWRVSPTVVIGGLLSSYGTSFPEVDAFGDSVGASLGRSVFAGGAVAAMRLADAVQAGVTLKSVTDELAGDKASVVAADIGIAVGLDDLSAGLSVRNVGPELRGDGGTAAEGESLPMEIRTGAAYTYPLWSATLGLEYVKAADRDGHIGVGVEWWPAKIFALRLGMTGLQTDNSQFTFGLSGIHQGIGLDYAYASHPLGATHRASLSYAFGQRVAEISAQTPVPLPPQKVDVVPLPPRKAAVVPLQEIPLPPRKQAVLSRHPAKATVKKSQREVELEQEIKRERRLLELEREMRKLRRERQGGKEPADQP